MKKAFSFFILAISACALFLFYDGEGSVVWAQEFDKIEVSFQSNAGTENLFSGGYTKSVTFKTSDVITITANGQPIDSIYIIWDSPVKTYTLTTEYSNSIHGENGFLHEFIKLDKPSLSVSLSAPEVEMKICGIRAFSEGEIPLDVQTWNPPSNKADLLVFSTHADDEVLWFGAAIAMYALEEELDTQVVYLCDYNVQTPYRNPRREHEKLDGLWILGVRNYPVNMSFGDYYANSIEAARASYDYDSVLTEVTSNIRRFKPQVIICHDLNGEYGHGGHMLLAGAVTEAVNNCANEAFKPESVSEYGVWDPLKTYVHVLGENEIELNVTEVLEKAGKNAMEVALDAFRKHVTQLGSWFYITNERTLNDSRVKGNGLSCAHYGLYRSLVGEDTSNDMFEHIQSYAEQERIALEEAKRLEEERLLNEKLEKEREEAKRLLEEKKQALMLEQFKQEEEAAKALKEKEEADALRTKIIMVLLILVFLIIFTCVVTVMRARRRKRRRTGRRNY